jgi:hypothetical protein
MAGQQFSNQLNPHPHFCLCAVENESELKAELSKIQSSGIKAVAWQEPDRNNELTAWASEPVKGPNRLLFKHLKTLKVKGAYSIV